MKASKEGSILLLISGLIGLFLSFLALIVLIVVMFTQQSEVTNFVLILLFIGLLFMIGTSILRLYLAKMMKKPRTTLNAGIIALILAFLTMFFGMPDVFAMAGGIVAVIHGSEK